MSLKNQKSNNKKLVHVNNCKKAKKYFQYPVKLNLKSYE
tara:strand:- start:2104 stop:2220 length:117 start_codon:yes stop_codon:yes gene_type:complete